MLENVDFKQIYRKINSKANELAKAGATVLDGDLVICLMTMVVFVEHVCFIWAFIILWCVDLSVFFIAFWAYMDIPFWDVQNYWILDLLCRIGYTMIIYGYLIAMILCKNFFCRFFLILWRNGQLAFVILYHLNNVFLHFCI